MQRSLPALAAQILVAAAIVLGGGGSSSPLWELALQLVFAAAVLALAVAGCGRALTPSSAGIAIIAAIAVGLPLLQLVPLPASLWQSLPGRDGEVAALQLLGADSRWMPWTQTPSRTLASLIAILPPVILMLLAARLPLHDRSRLLVVIVIGGLASVVLGALQLADGEGTTWRLQADTHLTWLTGFQANRNAEVDVLIISLLATAALAAGLIRQKGRRSSDRTLRWWPLVAAPLLVFGALLTGSRMGVVLLLPASIAAGAIVWMAHRRSSPSRTVVVASLAAVVLAGLALSEVPSLQRVAGRFLTDGDDRSELWADTREAVARHWPAGSGIGSFQPVFMAAERLEYVDESIPVRAHNDYLEFTLEAGVVGWILALVVAGTIGIRVRHLLARWRGTPENDSGEAMAQQMFGLAAISVIGLHALVDYPFRSMSLACLCAVAVAMLFSPIDQNDAPASLPSA